MKISRVAGSRLLSRAHAIPGQQDIRDFLQAVSSYPESFAINPGMSFEQHLVIIAAENRMQARREG